MKLGDSALKAQTPEYQLGQFIGMDSTGRNFDFQARVVVGETVVHEGVCRTIGVTDPNAEIEVDDKGQLTNAKIIKAKTGVLKGQYAYIVLKGFEPDVTGLGAQAWK